MKKWIKPLIPFMVLLTLLVGLFGYAPDMVGSPLGWIFDPTGNPFPHRFSDEADQFAELLDTPDSFTGEGGKLVRVNTTPNAVEFTNLGSIIVVAAADSSAAAKASALASGGAICDTIDDETEIQAAINIADDNGGSVFLPAGNYEIESANLTVTCLVTGETDYNSGGTVGTIIYVDPAYKIILKPPQGRLRKAFVATNSKSDCKPLIEVVGDTVTDTGYEARSKILDKITVAQWSSDQTGYGIYIHSKATDGAHSSYTMLSTFGDITAIDFEHGVYLHAEETAGDAFINGNNFEHLHLCQCKYSLTLDGDGSAEVSGNSFQSVQIQPDANTVDGISLDNHCENNSFYGIAWEWFRASGKVIHIKNANCIFNYFQGQFGAYTGLQDDISDVGKDNEIYTNALRIVPTTLGDDRYFGDAIIRFGTAGEALDQEDVCYLHTDGKWYEADADTYAESSGLLAIQIADPTPTGDGDTGMFLIRGHAAESTWALTPGNDCFLSITQGTFSQTAPVGAGDIIRTIGYATDANTIYFNPDNTCFELDAGGQIVKIDNYAITETP